MVIKIFNYIKNIVKQQLNVINEIIISKTSSKTTIKRYKKKKKLKKEEIKTNNYLKNTGIKWILLGSFICKTRKNNFKMRQANVANILNISPSKLSRIETGKEELTFDIAVKIDKLFKTNISNMWKKYDLALNKRDKKRKERKI